MYYEIEGQTFSLLASIDLPRLILVLNPFLSYIFAKKLNSTGIFGKIFCGFADFSPRFYRFGFPRNSEKNPLVFIGCAYKSVYAINDEFNTLINKTIKRSCPADLRRAKRLRLEA